MSLLTDLYLLGKKKGYDCTLLLKEQRITHYIDTTNGNLNIIKSDDKKGDVHMMTDVGARPGVGSVKVNNFWDSFGYYDPQKLPDERNKAFWDNAEAILFAIGDQRSLDIIRKLRELCYLPDIAKDETGRFAIRIGGQPIINRKDVLNYIERTSVPADGNSVCLLSGEKCFPTRLHPGVAINGFEHRVAPMVSFNAKVFEYGGLSQGNNFPVSQKAANAYSKMLEELGKSVIKLPVYSNGKTENKIAVIVWSSEYSLNVDKIQSILDSQVPDWDFAEPKGNIHFLAMRMEKQRRPILAYDVFPERKVIENLITFKKESIGLFNDKGIKQCVHKLESVKQIGKVISPEMVVQFYRYVLFKIMYPKTIKQNIVQLFNKRMMSKDGSVNHLSRSYVKWVEFFLFAEMGAK